MFLRPNQQPSRQELWRMSFAVPNIDSLECMRFCTRWNYLRHFHPAHEHHFSRNCPPWCEIDGFSFFGLFLLGQHRILGVLRGARLRLPRWFPHGLAHSERVEALTIQDAVAHNEGLGANWKTRRAFWADRGANENTLRTNLLSLASTRTRHVGKVPPSQDNSQDFYYTDHSPNNRSPALTG
jgi:hypothetical protein